MDGDCESFRFTYFSKIKYEFFFTKEAYIILNHSMAKVRMHLFQILTSNASLNLREKSNILQKITQ